MAQDDPNIKAEVIADSVNKFGNRLTTMIINFPRFILAEVNTHRMLSKSTASSRAIPLRKQIQKVRDNPFIPPFIGKNQSGMTAREELIPDEIQRFKWNWTLGAGTACQIAETFDKMGVHKQTASRILEPWLYCKMIISGTEWANFFSLRCSLSSQPEFQILAYRMLEAYVESEPKLNTGWHIPFGDRMPNGLSEEDKLLIAIGRCARMSYENHDGDYSPDKDIALTKRLLADRHLVPAEHVAYANNHSDIMSANFKGWIQYRKRINAENITKLDYHELLVKKPEWIM